MTRIFAPLGVDIAAILATEMGPLLLDATLTKVTPGTRTPGNLTGGTNPTTATYAAKGFMKDYKDYQIDGTIVKRGDRIAALLGDTISSSQVPKPGDRVTMESFEWNIVQVKRDAAEAVYKCQVRAE